MRNCTAKSIAAITTKRRVNGSVQVTMADLLNYEAAITPSVLIVP